MAFTCIDIATVLSYTSSSHHTFVNHLADADCFSRCEVWLFATARNNWRQKLPWDVVWQHIVWTSFVAYWHLWPKLQGREFIFVFTQSVQQTSHLRVLVCLLSLNKPNARILKYVLYGPWFPYGWAKENGIQVWYQLTTPSQQCPLQLSSNWCGHKELGGAHQSIPPYFDLRSIITSCTWSAAFFLWTYRDLTYNEKSSVSFSFGGTGSTQATRTVCLWNTESNTHPPLVGGHVVCNISAVH